MIQQNINPYCCGILDVGCFYEYENGKNTYSPLRAETVEMFTQEVKNGTNLRSEGLATYSTVDPSENLHAALVEAGWVLAAKFKSRMGNYPVWYYTLIVRPYKGAV